MFRSRIVEAFKKGAFFFPLYVIVVQKVVLLKRREFVRLLLILGTPILVLQTPKRGA